MQHPEHDAHQPRPRTGRTLYRPEFEHDACGIGALANIDGTRSHQILDDALSVLVNLEHRGGTGLERTTGDGAGHPLPGAAPFLPQGGAALRAHPAG